MNKFHKLDLNLLRAFTFIYEKGSVTEAAHALDVTQSAMSHMLGRLRGLLGEPLFVRHGRGLRPTSGAEVLYAPLSHALGQIEETLHAMGRFDPASTSRTFVLAVPDYVEITCLPRLFAALSSTAPMASIECVDPGDRPLADFLDEVDLAIARFDDPPPRSHLRRLWHERFVTVRSTNHPRIDGDKLTLARFLAEGHIMVGSRSGRSGAVDLALKNAGLERRVVVKTGYFHTPVRMVAQSELLATVPKSLAQALATELELTQHEPPIAVPGFDVSMVWSERLHADPGHRWLRDWVRDTVGSAAPRTEGLTSRPIK